MGNKTLGKRNETLGKRNKTQENRCKAHMIKVLFKSFDPNFEALFPNF